MNQSTTLRSIAITFAVFLMAGCATSKTVGEWRSESFSGQVNNILIIGVTSRSTRRRVFEDKFVEGLAAGGTTAVPSYRLLESSLYLTRDVIERAIEGQNLGAVLVTRLAGVKEEEHYRLPASYDHERGYFGYYDHAWQETNTGYYSEYKIFTLETNLYDTTSGELIWSMQSETMDSSKPRQIIEDQIALTIKTLAKRGLIPAGP